ncbi:exported hypothetical protein [Pseudoalteromonas sp. 3J6]|nr:exported hypothetical protein [Pseudoalteromonas sp. 3J6]
MDTKQLACAPTSLILASYFVPFMASVSLQNKGDVSGIFLVGKNS